MSESLRIDKWLTHIFTSDSVLTGAGNQGISAGKSPSGAKFPRQIFNLQSGRDMQGTGRKRLLSNPLYQIKTVFKGGVTAQIVTIIDRIDARLQNTTNEVYEGYVFSARREQEINYTENGVDASDSFRHVGGLYRISCYKYGV